jgi:hypothetical protein
MVRSNNGHAATRHRGVVSATPAAVRAVTFRWQSATGAGAFAAPSIGGGSEDAEAVTMASSAVYMLLRALSLGLILCGGVGACRATPTIVEFVNTGLAGKCN